MGAALHAARCVGNEVLPMGIFSSLRLWGSLAGLEQQIFEENQDLTLDGRAQAAIGLIACAHLRLSAQCVAVLAGGAADGTPASPAGRAAGARRAVGAGADCYRLEKRRYVQAEQALIADIGPAYTSATVFQQATMVDFLWNKGASAWRTSTMRKLLLAGDVEAACRQNERWTRGTVNGVSTALPGLVTRANANSDLCAEGL